jgi:hypothetical protein
VNFRGKSGFMGAGIRLKKITTEKTPICAELKFDRFSMSLKSTCVADDFMNHAG